MKPQFHICGTFNMCDEHVEDFSQFDPKSKDSDSSDYSENLNSAENPNYPDHRESYNNFYRYSTAEFNESD